MKKYLAAFLLADLMMKTATGYNQYDETRDTRKCGSCKHCKKSFCKLSKHHISKYTPVNYCKYFEEL